MLQHIICWIKAFIFHYGSYENCQIAMLHGPCRWTENHCWDPLLGELSCFLIVELIPCFFGKFANSLIMCRSHVNSLSVPCCTTLDGPLSSSCLYSLSFMKQMESMLPSNKILSVSSASQSCQL